jgi:FixJ family two-component response regulator
MTIKISDVFPKLTKRQREVCALLIIGYSNKRVGHVLGISSRTIEDHRRERFQGGRRCQPSRSRHEALWLS